MAGRLALLGALIALCASGWTVHRVNQLQTVVLDQQAHPALDRSGEPVDDRVPESVGRAAAAEPVPIPASAPSAPARPLAPAPGQAIGAIGERQRAAVLTNRGDGQVVNLGEAMDADATYFDSGSGEVIDLGERLEP